MRRLIMVNTNEIPLQQRLVLGLGFFASFFMIQGVHILAIPYYQMTLGVDPFLLSVAITLPLLIGASFGPLVGHISDNFVSKYGKRKPFIVVACWFAAVCYGGMWAVPSTWNQSTQLLYLSGMATFFFIASTFYSVSLNSLTCESANNYHQRTELLGFTAYFVKAGSLIYQWVFPLTQLSIFGSVYFGIKAVGWGMGVLIFGLCGTLPGLFASERQMKNLPRLRKPRFFASMALVLQQPDMRRLIGLTLLQMGCAACVSMMDYNLLVYYVHTGDISEGAFWKAVLSTSFAVASMVYVPIVTRLSYRFGKIGALKIVFCLNILGGAAKWFIFVPGAQWSIVLDAVFCSAIWTAMVILVPSILADISQHTSDTDNTTHTGVFVSVHGWVVSFSGVMAFIFYGLGLNLVDFDASLGVAQHSSSILWMRGLLSGGTVFFSCISLLLLFCWRLKNSR